jgi:PAS domain S-box-containing protein
VEAVLKIEYLHQSREEVLREFIENGYWRGEVIQYHKDGSPIDIVASVRLLKDAQGKSSGMVAVNRDVTDYRVAEKAVQQQAELLQTVFDTLPVMVVVFDPNGQRTLINREYERTLGWSLAEIWRHPDVMSELYPDPDYRRYVQEHMTASDNDWHEFKIRTRDGCIIDTLWANARLSDGSIIGIGQDITERKRAQEDLLKARVLDAELRKERELNDLKTRFISMLSHEFRTPLAVVLSSADILRRYRERLSPEKIEEHLDKIAKQVSRLTPLIDDVLALNRAETVREHLQPMPIDLEAFCWMLIDELQPTAPHHRIVFTGDSAATDIEADEKYLRLAITNLLSNAIKYSPQGGRIEVELFRNGAEVTLSVTDHGIGVPEEDQAHLFEVFHRATNVGAISGTGLGLSIVKRAVELHKGRVEFSSQEGIGTRFTLRLPMASGAVTIGGGSIS